MFKKLLLLRSQVLMVLFIQVVLTIFLMLINFNMWNLYALFILIMDAVLCVFMIQKAIQVYDNQYLSTKKAVGTDAYQAMLYGEVAIIVYDENKEIVWISELLIERGNDLIGSHINELELSVATDTTSYLNLDDYKYEVVINEKYNSLYLKDVTEYQKISEAYNDQKIVVAYLHIDNFDEATNRLDEQQKALLTARLRQILTDWTGSKHIFVVRSRDREQSYALVLNQKQLEIIEKERFKILDRIKEETKYLETPITISIGIGVDDTDLLRLAELADSALELALSRGGDQAIVKSAIKEIRFYGASGEASEKQNRVRVRVVTHAIVGLVKTASKVFVMGHRFSDFDSFGSSVGVFKLVENYCEKVYIVVNTNDMEEKLKQTYFNFMNKYPQYKKNIISPNEAIKLADNKSVLVLVDNHKLGLAIEPELFSKVEHTVVIDHHRRGEDFVNNPTIVHIDVAASSTTEIVTEMYSYIDKEVKLNSDEATIMLAGIIVDTGNFKNRTGVRTFIAASVLRDFGANVSNANEYLEDTFDEIMLKNKLMATAQTIDKGVVMLFGDDKEILNQTTLAKTANDLINTKDIEAVFVVGRTKEDGVSTSARSRSTFNVQLVMEKLGGGGHFSSAACFIEELKVEEVCDNLLIEVERYLRERGEQK